MSEVTIDFVASSPDGDIWSLVVVEQGPWEEDAIPENLRRLQSRLYDYLDVAIDGKFAEAYPESRGKRILIQLDGYSLPENEVSSFFESFSDSVLEIPEYKLALSNNEYVDSISFQINLRELTSGI